MFEDEDEDEIDCGNNSEFDAVDLSELNEPMRGLVLQSGVRW